MIRRTGDSHARQSETTFLSRLPTPIQMWRLYPLLGRCGAACFRVSRLKWATHTRCPVPCERTPWSLLRCTLHVTVSRAIGCRFLSCVVVTSPTVITCSNGLTEEALWEGVLLPALLPACSLRSVFFSGRWPGPVGSFRSTAPHHNPPFLELATTSSPCQAMKLCESASNVELPLKPKSCWFQTELDDLDT